VKNKFKLSRVAASVAVAISGLAGSHAAFAGAGFTDVIAADGVTTLRKATFFAYSPTGPRDTAIPEGNTLGVGQNTGKALRKFVDPLPLPGAANAKTMADGVTQKYIPVAQVSKWVNPQGKPTTHDYYEIGIVEYSEKFHSDLAKPTLLRGYVQIDHLATNGLTGADGNKFLPGSKQFALTYPDGSPILIAGTDVNGKLTGLKVPALAVDAPHFLGPVIAATKDTPTRLKVLNLLPVGRAEFAAGTKNEVDPATGLLRPVSTYDVINRHGDLFLPVDKSILGAGVGPDGLTEYTQNRASVHLHGGDTPWISDGTPHQWITPAGENDATVAGSLAAAFNDPLGFLDPAMLPNYTKGVSTQNVPDMNDPGDGAMTLYFPNGHTARMEWYHDHTFGSTRLNVYAGMASAYLVTDSVEAALVQDGSGVTTVGTGAYAKTVAAVLPPASRTIPLVMQDRTFVPDDIALQDAHWNTTAWGQPGDSWFPHVYETVQDPNQVNNWNSVGRWHYGPWFWPVFPALYNLPEGTYSPAGYENTVTTTPEGWHDTPVINGVAYPTLEVDPTTYRFRLLNATNDRMLTFNLFEATDSATLADGTPSINTNSLDANGFAIKSELNMVPAGAPLAADSCAPGQRRPTPIGNTSKFCTPETWPTDGRIGGVPNPAGVGPTMYQVANESGWLPKVATYEPTPINYIQDKGRIVVLNVDLGKSGLLIAPAERADVVIDFSQYAGKTLLVYNDSGAPVPAGDPRNDLFTGVGDQTGQGGAEDTKPGYGPNTRTMMQIVVRAVATGPVSPALDPVALNASISNAYFSDPARRPVVAQDVYSGFDASWASMKPVDMYGDIYLGSLKNPTFKFTPGTPSDGVANVAVATPGSGYVVTPDVSIAPPKAAGGVAATAVASMKIEKFNITNVGKGYTAAPLMSFSAGGGNGAMANAFLRVDTTSGAVTAPGAGYAPASGRLAITFTPAPGATVNNPTPGVTPTGYATVTAGKVTGITVLTAGKGYTAIPLITITNKDYVSNLMGPGTGAKATVTGVVDSIVLYGTDNTTPAMNAATSGGGGYTDLSTLNVNIRGGLPIDPATGLAKAGTVNAVATASGKVYDITLTHPGSGYAANEVPGVTLTQKINGVVTVPATVATATATAAATSGAKASYLVKTKTIQELFDPTYGRLNATLGIELPFTSALTQTTIPLGYVDETTEKFADGETQIWKITHNGVDSHPVHFHLLDVQVINRVGWDGFIQPIEPKEMGWKETIMMSPLEDIIVAVRAKKPTLPGFGVPLSERLMDPTQPLGSPFGFTQIDPATGNPAVVTNALVNFGWEYVWHCHILGHEENDFMRPIAFAANEAMPASSAPTVTVGVVGSTATISYVDNSTTEFKYSVRRADVALNGTVGAYAEIGTELALSAPTLGSSLVDPTPLAASAYYSYQVAAIGAAGEAATAVKVSTFVTPVAPALTGGAVDATHVKLDWTIATGTAVTGYTVSRNGVAIANLSATTLTYTDATATASTAYTYVVTAVNGDKSTVSNTLPVTTPAIPLSAPSGLVGYLASTTSATLTWTDNSKIENSFVIYRKVNNGPFALLTTVTRTAAQATASGGTVSYTNTGLANGSTYAYYVVAAVTAPAAVSAQSNTFTLTVGAPAAPSAVAVTNVVRNTLFGIPTNTDAVSLSWTQVGNVPATSVTVQYANNVNFTGATTVTANNVNGATTATVNVNRGIGANPNPVSVYIRMSATNARGTSANSTVIGPIALR